MHAPRRKQMNTIDAASLARWLVITGFAAVTGLIYVYLTLQLHHLGDRKKVLENELISLRAQNEVASGQINALTSRAALERQQKKGTLKMIPIAEHSIVRLSPPSHRLGEDAVQPVANQRAGR